MAPARLWLVAAATLLAAVLGAWFFRALHLPLAAILGSMLGSTIVANLFGAMGGGRKLRRLGQLFVGASIGAVLTPDVIGELYRLFPLMLGVAIASNLFGLVLAFPVAKIAGVDKLTAMLSSLPAGMAEMATLAHDLKADEQVVAFIHTIRVVMVLLLIPAWIGFVAPGSVPALLSVWDGLAETLALVAAAAVIAALATRFNVINAWIIAPMLLCLAVVAAGHSLPPVPPIILLAAQIAIGVSLGLRFRVDSLRRFPRVALAGLLSALLLAGGAFTVLATSVEGLGELDHVSAILAVAPGGLGEMIASAGALGLLAATVAGFQLTRSVLTNLLVPPVIRWIVRGRPNNKQ